MLVCFLNYLSEREGKKSTAHALHVTKGMKEYPPEQADGMQPGCIHLSPVYAGNKAQGHSP